MSTQDALHEVQMLHPMTLLQRFLLSLPAFLVLLFPLLRSPESSDYVLILTVIAYSVLALPLIFLRYFRFRYRITPKEIIIQSGIFTRQHRSIPIERIQNIEIEQSLLPRIFNMAKVNIETAGSAKTEGVLEFVSKARAYQIREIVRSYQLEQTETVQSDPEERAIDTIAENVRSGSSSTFQSSSPPLYAMSLDRVFLAGMMRFSMLYIAIAFSLIQQLAPDYDEITLWLTKGWLRPLAEFAQHSPWSLTIGTIVGAMILSWITGILVSLNSNYSFKIWLENNKLHKHQGLLTVSQGTIPIKRIQTLIFRANPVMRRLGWTALDVQTMGIESSQRRHQVAVPLGKVEETVEIAQHVLPLSLPETFSPVSRLTIRRTIIRFTMLTVFIFLPVSYYWQQALWGLLIILFIPLYAYLRYKNHGYALEGNNLYIRRGVFRHYIWVVPASKFQVLYTTASLFQRRLGLSTVYIDTAGAASFATPEIIDIETKEAETLIERCYSTFQAAFTSSSASP